MIISPAALDALEAKAKAATLAKETPAGMFAPGVRDRVWNEFIAAASPDVVLALVAELRRLQGIARDLAAAKVHRETFPSHCYFCGEHMDGPVHKHDAGCLHRRAVEEQPK